MNNFIEATLGLGMFALLIMGLQAAHMVEMARKGPRGLKKVRQLSETTPYVPMISVEGAWIVSTAMLYMFMMMLAGLADNVSDSVGWASFGICLVVFAIGVYVQIKVDDIIDNIEQEQRSKQPLQEPAE